MGRRSDADDPRKRRPARRWQGLTAGAGALMAVTFFLPAVKSCSSDIIPAHDYPEAVAEAFDESHAPDTLRVLALWTPVLLVPYVLGLTLCLAAIARLAGWERMHSRLIQTVIAGLLMTSLATSGLFVDELARGSPRWFSLAEWPTLLATVIGPAMTVLYLIVARRSWERLTYGTMFLTSFWMLCWFGFWVNDARYGLHLSFAAAVLLLIGVIGEARAVTRQTWLRTAGQLLLARLTMSTEKRGRCPGCGYLLYGLQVMRCPECGRAFDWPEVGLTPDEAEAAAAGSPRSDAI